MPLTGVVSSHIMGFGGSPKWVARPVQRGAFFAVRPGLRPAGRSPTWVGPPPRNGSVSLTRVKTPPAGADARDVATLEAPMTAAFEAEMMQGLRSHEKRRLVHADSLLAWAAGALFMAAAITLAVVAGSMPTLWVAALLIGIYALALAGHLRGRQRPRAAHRARARTDALRPPARDRPALRRRRARPRPRPRARARQGARRPHPAPLRRRRPCARAGDRARRRRRRRSVAASLARSTSPRSRPSSRPTTRRRCRSRAPCSACVRWPTSARCSGCSSWTPASRRSGSSPPRSACTAPPPSCS